VIAQASLRSAIPALAVLAAGAIVSSAADLPQLGKSPTREVIAAMTREEKVNLVTGTGMRRPGLPAGREVLQLYLSAPGKVAPKPALELRGFAKTKALKPGESQTLSFPLTARDLTSFDEASSAWLAEAGTYTVKVGASSEDIRQTATFVKAREEKVATVSTSILSRP